MSLKYYQGMQFWLLARWDNFLKKNSNTYVSQKYISCAGAKVDRLILL